MNATHAATPDSATDCTCGRTFGSHMGRRNHLTAAAKRAANEEATAARMAQVKAEAHPLLTAASRPDAETIAPAAPLATDGLPPIGDPRWIEAAARGIGMADLLAAQAAAAEQPADSDTCEHGIPMTDPCSPCAVAGHEPVDVAPAPLTDNARHLADCRSCALHLPDGHDYVSLLDAPLTVDELRTLAARTDVADDVRQAAADTLAELVNELVYLADVVNNSDDPEDVLNANTAIDVLTAERAGASDRDCADDVACPCGNDVMGEGFTTATPAGLCSAAKDGPWDGRTIACGACGRLIDTDPDEAEPAADEFYPWTFPVTGRLA